MSACSGGGIEIEGAGEWGSILCGRLYGQLRFILAGVESIDSYAISILSLYSPYYVEAYNELGGPIPWIS